MESLRLLLYKMRTRPSYIIECHREWAKNMKFHRRLFLFMEWLSMSRWSFWSENCHCFWNAQTCSAILSGSLATDSKEVLCADKSVILTFYVTSVVLTFCDSNFFTNHTGLCLAAEWIRTAVLLEVLSDKFHHVHPWLLLILVCFGDCIVWICLDMFGLWIVSVSSLFSLIHRPEWRVWTNTIGYNGMQGNGI